MDDRRIGIRPGRRDHPFYRDQGLSTIPLYGALGVAVPGAPAALAALHTHGASRGLPELWEPAARIAETGLACSAKTAADVCEALTAIRHDPGLAAVYAPDGGAAQVGDRITQPDLARTIRQLAHDPTDFYTGEFAERAVTMLSAAGAPFSGAEWAAAEVAEPETAITGSYAGATIHQTPVAPHPVGWCCSRPRCATAASGANPGWVPVPSTGWPAPPAWPSPTAWRCAAAITPVGVMFWTPTGLRANVRTWRTRTRTGWRFRCAARTPPAPLPWMPTVARCHSSTRWVSPSGATLTVPGTGVVLNNRLGREALRSQATQAKSRRDANRSIPSTPGSPPERARSCWLLAAFPAGMGRCNGTCSCCHICSTTGWTRLPRWPRAAFTVFPGSDAEVIDQPAELRVEDRIDEQTRERLRANGHRVVVQAPYGAGGSAQVICRDDHGVLRGAADPRQEGVAIGVD